MFRKIKEALKKIERMYTNIFFIKEKIYSLGGQITKMQEQISAFSLDIRTIKDSFIYDNEHGKITHDLAEVLILYLDKFVYITDIPTGKPLYGGYLKTFGVTTTSFYNMEKRGYDSIHKKIMIVHIVEDGKERIINITDNMSISSDMS